MHRIEAHRHPLIDVGTAWAVRARRHVSRTRRWLTNRSSYSLFGDVHLRTFLGATVQLHTFRRGPRYRLCRLDVKFSNGRNGRSSYGLCGLSKVQLHTF